MKYWKEVEAAAKEHGFNPRLIYAICMKESSMDPWAMRFEPGWRWWLAPAKWARRVRVTTRTEEIAQQCSWGLMQIMGTVARERGFTGDIPQLCDVKTNLKYGCLQVKHLFARYSDVRHVLSAYNTGRPETPVGRAYATDVLKIMSEL
jgi:soluble lytic murein transglycosylase-like protein